MEEGWLSFMDEYWAQVKDLFRSSELKLFGPSHSWRRSFSPAVSQSREVRILTYSCVNR